MIGNICAQTGENRDILPERGKSTNLRPYREGNLYKPFKRYTKRLLNGKFVYLILR